MRRCWQEQAGEITLWAVIGVALIVVAYLLYPSLFQDFVHFVINQALDALDKAFGGHSPRVSKGTAQ